jgi:hypothetical protein
VGLANIFDARTMDGISAVNLLCLLIHTTRISWPTSSQAKVHHGEVSEIRHSRTPRLGYVLKQRMDTDLIPAINLATGGSRFVSHGCEPDVLGR